jgi:predicted TIM-barrel enzyme
MIQFVASADRLIQNEDLLIFSPVMADLPVGAASVLASLSISDCNGALLEELKAVDELPGRCLVGIFAVDPLRHWKELLGEVRRRGGNGIVNWPSVGVLGAAFDQELEQDSLGFSKEVEFIAVSEGLGFSTMAAVFTVEQANLMIGAGCKCLLLHPPLELGEPGLGPKSHNWFSQTAGCLTASGVEAFLYAETDECNLSKLLGRAGSANICVYVR